MRPTRTVHLALLTTWLLVGPARPAWADLTAFVGLSPTPDTHSARGFSGGLSLLVIGFEVEVSHITEDQAKALPSLQTYSGNVLVQTPVEIKGVQLYGTTGASGYRERLIDAQETNVGVNVGGGAKIRIAGPLRIRLDYRVFRLNGEPIHATYQRFYAGANLAF